MRQIAIIAAVGIVATVTASAVAAEPGSWHCEKPPVRHAETRENLRSISTKPSLKNVLVEYMRRWDATEMRATCEAFAAGEPAQITCLNGRRDWNAIRASIPGDLLGLSASAHRQHLLQIKDEGNGLQESLDYCRSVGALTDPGFSLKVGDDS